jgi:hypothetical protein
MILSLLSSTYNSKMTRESVELIHACKTKTLLES